MKSSNRIVRRVLRVGRAGVLGLCLFNAGCVTASLATIGTVFGVLGSAASTGADVYKLGKLDAAVMGSFDDSQWAVLMAAGELGLHVTADAAADKCGYVHKFVLRDLRETTTGVTVERRTDRLCRVRVDVGIFGSEPTARLLMDRVKANLPDLGNGPSVNQP